MHRRARQQDTHPGRHTRRWCPRLHRDSLVIARLVVTPPRAAGSRLLCTLFKYFSAILRCCHSHEEKRETVSLDRFYGSESLAKFGIVLHARWTTLKRTSCPVLSCPGGRSRHSPRFLGKGHHGLRGSRTRREPRWAASSSLSHHCVNLCEDWSRGKRRQV